MKWVLILRAPFLTASIVPILIGAAWAGGALPRFPWLLFALVLLGGCALHLAANTFNDYFDWTSGTDQRNSEYFPGLSGGSRAIERGLISEARLLRLAVALLALASAAGALLAWLSGPALLLYGVAGAFCAYFYTAPPLRLVARKGLGELLIGLCFGPLLVAGTVHALSGRADFFALLLGLPSGLLTAAILFINEFPDARADAESGKNHLVVQLGKRRARWGYVALLLSAFGALALLVLAGPLPPLVSLAAIALPIAAYAAVIVLERYDDPSLVRASRATVQLHLIAGLGIAAGLLLG